MNAPTRHIGRRAIEEINMIGITDSYKISHHKQYPPGTTKVYSYLESRGGEFSEILFFGLQYILRRYLVGQVITSDNVEETAEDMALHFGNDTIFNRAGWEYILRVHHGRLPVTIKAVPEGTRVPTGNVLMTVENTDPRVPWITNYVETLLSQVWYPLTVATQSNEMRRLIMKWLVRTGDPSLIDFKVHDFGFRGSTSIESAGIGAAAHLVSFKGTDTIQGLRVARKYYGERMAGFSVPAAEHSTITSWGREHEADAYRNMLEQFPTGLLAVVSDSYDVFEACAKLWGTQLKDQVLGRDGTLVVRPDSGNPPEIVIKVLGILGKQFGYAVNDKGYKVLNPKVRVIQGDGINYAMIDTVLRTMAAHGWSADNVAFGSGGALLQKLDRDTQKIAFKASAVEVDGVVRDIAKDPITDPGKRSKSGRLMLVKLPGAHGYGYKTMRQEDAARHGTEDELKPVFSNGLLLSHQRFADIRARAGMRT